MARIPVGTTDYKKGLIYYASPDVRGSSTRDVFKPQAINRNGYVYFTWVDYQGDIYVTKFKSTESFGTGILIATRSADYSSGSDIEHSVPTMCIDTNGYIYIFYGAHDTNSLYFRKSTNPYDVSAWGTKQQVTPATNSAYPQPIVTNDNKIWVFYRQSNGAGLKRFSYTTSTDGGSTWSSAVDLITPNTANTWMYPLGVVVGTESGTSSVHVMTSFRGVTFSNTNYCVTYDGGTTWKKADGTTLTLPINESTCDVIEAAEAYPGDIKLNSSNQPYVCYMINGGTVKFARFTAGAWSKTSVSTVGNYAYEVAEIDIISDSTIDVYTIDGTSTIQGGDVERYRSTDTGASFTLAENITSNATDTFRYYFPKVVANNDSNCKLIYMYGNPTTTYTYVGTNFKFLTYP